MNALEERLRRAVDAEVAVPPGELYVERVRRGARRRRTRQALAVSVAAVVALVAGIALATVRPGEAPEPVGPGPVVEQDGAPDASGPVVLLTRSGSAAEGRLYGVSAHGSADCWAACANTLWVLENGRRKAVFRFPADLLLADVVMAPDGQNGFAVTYSRTPLLRTRDGGESWFVVEDPFIDRRSNLEVELLGEHVYAYVGGGMTGVRPGDDGSSPKQHRLWRSPLDGDGWSEVSLPFAPGFDFSHVPDASGAPAMLALETSRGEWSEYWTSSDGTTWQPAGPRPPCERPAAESWLRLGLLWVWCGDDTAGQLHRSVRLGPFEAWGPIFELDLRKKVLGPVLLEGAAPDDVVALVLDGHQAYRLTLDGRTEPVAPPDVFRGWVDSFAADSLAVSHRGATYVRDPAGALHVTDDGGMTWSPGP